jgi:dihydroxyacid dehydratase/phosphogluconate dehydratase
MAYLKKSFSRAGGVAQVVENLPSRHKALNSNSSTVTKKKRTFVNFGGLEIQLRYL